MGLAGLLVLLVTHEAGKGAACLLVLTIQEEVEEVAVILVEVAVMHFPQQVITTDILEAAAHPTGCHFLMAAMSPLFLLPAQLVDHNNWRDLMGMSLFRVCLAEAGPRSARVPLIPGDL